MSDLLYPHQKVRKYKKEARTLYVRGDVDAYVEKLKLLGLKLRGAETDMLLLKARKLGVDIPENPAWWRVDTFLEQNFLGEFPDENGKRRYLTEAGFYGMTRLVREAQRSNIEWWIKVTGGVLAGMTGLAGTIIGIIAILSK
jgi:hypothetical protein